jgi:hypothetical protein
MFAYSMAAAHTELPHLTLINHMVSNAGMGDLEGWKYIDALEENVCEPPVNNIYYPDEILPTFLHYCQFFRAGEFGFQKRMFRKTMLTCDHPIMLEPPIDLGKVDYKNKDGEVYYPSHCMSSSFFNFLFVLHFLYCIFYR